MKTSFILRFNPKNSELSLNNDPIDKFVFKTADNKKIEFKIIKYELVVVVDFYLLDNVYFSLQDGFYIFSNELNSYANYGIVDAHYMENMKQHGFLPHSATAFNEIYCLCSFLKYRFGKKIDISLGVKFEYGNYNLSDLIYRFESAINNFKSLHLGENLIISLSGGMDSRLLLDRFLDWDKLDLITFGLKNSGDVLVAKKVVEILNIKKKHSTVYLEDLTYTDILKNFYTADYFLPMQRVLYPNISDIFKKGVLISGLYGDVIFDDNNKVEKYSSYNQFLKENNVLITNEVDFLVALAYDNLPNWEKLYRIILRCQKLTKQGVLLHCRNLDCFIPFLDINVLKVACQINTDQMYSKLVKMLMKPELYKIIHQSSLSYFCHNKYLRKLEGHYYMRTKSKYRIQYFDQYYLQSIGINVDSNYIPSISELQSS